LHALHPGILTPAVCLILESSDSNKSSNHQLFRQKSQLSGHQLSISDYQLTPRFNSGQVIIRYV
jgi:hypothetical protein